MVGLWLLDIILIPTQIYIFRMISVPIELNYYYYYGFRWLY